MKYIMIDLDGTVADMGKGYPGRRTPYDWDRVGEDDVHWDIVELVNVLRNDGYRVVWITGRDEVCREATRQWLCNIPGTLPGEWLVMRPAGDTRPDEVVKWELYQQIIFPKLGSPWLILDDRDKVVQMWRRDGLRCLQVADGDF